jgi:phosphoribosylanthranilate isomerase
MLCKICGLTRAEDVELCNALGADFVGFVFVRKSPRFVTPERAALLPGGRALRVGVFAGADRKEIDDIARRARLDLIQLHGGEGPELCRALGPERVIKVFWPERLGPGELEREAERFAPVCSRFLTDAGSGGGGGGKIPRAEALPRAPLPRPWLLAGGLGPDTLVSVLDGLFPERQPDGADLNSALESAPGVKDHELVRKAVLLVQTRSGRPAGRGTEKRS